LPKNGYIFERELKSILSGEFDKVAGISWLDDLLRIKISNHPFLVVRAAGSHGFDLLALRDDISFPIEVKSAKENIFNFSTSSGRSQKQAEEYVKLLGRMGIMPIYAFRLKGIKGDPWRLFTFNLEFKGKYRIIAEVIPKMEITRNGKYSMKWDEGMPLVKFIEYIF